METTLTVRLDQKLKDKSEKTLNKLGLTTAAAVRVFLTQVVEQQRIPFPLETTDALPALNTPIEFEYEVLRELMSTCLATLFRMKEKTSDTAYAKKCDDRITEIMQHRDSIPINQESIKTALDKYSELAGALDIQEEKLNATLAHPD